MTTSILETTARAVNVTFTDDDLVVSLSDGRVLSVPLAWFPRLLHATPEQRSEWRFIGDGEGIHWEAVDEDLSVIGLLRGAPAPPLRRS
jgi:hypothetical protein